MAFYLVFKVGNQGGRQSGNGHKDGMPVTMLPDGTRFSEHMRKVFAIIRMRDEMRSKALEALEPFMDGDTQKHSRSWHAPLASLAQELGSPQLVGQWRSKNKVVDVQHGENLPEDVFERSNGHDFGNRPDNNAINSGTCSIGPGGPAPNYVNWTAFLADISSLSGDLTAAQFASTTGENASPPFISINGYTLRMTCPWAASHQGDPTAGLMCGVASTGAVIAINFTGFVAGVGLVKVDGLRIDRTGNSGSGIQLGTLGPSVEVSDCIIDHNGVGGSCVFVQDSGGGSVGPATLIDVWNCDFIECSGNGFRNNVSQGATCTVENCTADECNTGFQLDDSRAFNNFAFNSGIQGFNQAGTTEGRNNGSEDDTCKDANWTVGANNNPNLTPANEFVSTSRTSSDYTKVRSDGGGVAWNGGRTPTIAGNTQGIRGDPRSSSIGSDEFAAGPPVATQRLGLQAKQSQLDVANLDHRLTSAETDVQKAVEKIDDVIAITTLDDQDMVALVTTIDGDDVVSTGITATPIEDGLVTVEINGQRVEVGDGSKVADCYFSGDGGTNPRNIADIQAGDTCHWMGSIAGYQLTASDRVSFVYGA